MQSDDLSYLIADDHEFQRGAMVMVLKSIGAATIHEAADGHEALAVIQDPLRPVDIVISDLDMPGMDGMEFIRRVGEARARVSFIVASSLERALIASIAAMARAYGVKLLGVVEKPLTRAKLEPLIALHRPPNAESIRPAATGAAFTLEEIGAGLQNDEFEPFFQPKVELATGRIKSAEALARWRHPQKGIVAPYAFIQPLEDNGMIDDLMWVMLRKSAACCSAWRKAELDAQVAVNLSVKSLADALLADRVTALVSAQQLKPRQMILEVTESAATFDVGMTLENLARLRLKGFGLSIDDYGTGYSSMQQLARIAFTEIKVDQSFVTNAGRQGSARVILESSLEMAKKLNITSVAEGVETQADWDLLRDIGCDLAQGYFIARPMEAAAFMDWVFGWNPPG